MTGTAAEMPHRAPSWTSTTVGRID